MSEVKGRIINETMKMSILNKGEFRFVLEAEPDKKFIVVNLVSNTSHNYKNYNIQYMGDVNVQSHDELDEENKYHNVVETFNVCVRLHCGVLSTVRQFSLEACRYGIYEIVKYIKNSQIDFDEIVIVNKSDDLYYTINNAFDMFNIFKTASLIYNLHISGKEMLIEASEDQYDLVVSVDPKPSKKKDKKKNKKKKKNK